MNKETMEMFFQWRDIEPDDVCPKCGGVGKHTYGDTTTWRGGTGGQTVTTDVCDLCWGSGSKRFPWTSWKTINNMLDWAREKREKK